MVSMVCVCVCVCVLVEAVGGEVTSCPYAFVRAVVCL